MWNVYRKQKKNIDNKCLLIYIPFTFSTSIYIRTCDFLLELKALNWKHTANCACVIPLIDGLGY